MPRGCFISMAFVLVLFATLIGFTCHSLTIPNRDLSGDFSSKDILSLKLGMSLEEVEKIMGRGYEMEVRVGHVHDMACDNSRNTLFLDLDAHTDMRGAAFVEFARTDFCCQSMREERDRKKITLTYTEGVFFSSSYPYLWLHFDSTFTLNEVYAKEYEGNFGLDDKTIYSLHRSGMSIEEEAFERCFGENRTNRYL